MPIGEKTADALMAKLEPKVRALKVAPGTDPEAEMGPLVTKQHYDKVKGYIDAGVAEGAKLVVDGRGLKLQGYENGYFLGGTLFHALSPRLRTGAAATRSLPSTRISPRPLPPDRKPLSMAQATVAPEVHQSLDVHRNLTPQITLDLVARVDDPSDLDQVVVGEIVRLPVERNLRGKKDISRPRTPDPKNIGHCDLHAFVAGEIYSSDSRQDSALLIPGAACAEGSRR